MAYTVINELPKRKRYTAVRKDIMRFWEDDNARYAEVDHSKYKNAGTCSTSYAAAARGMRVAVDVSCINGKVYMSKRI